MRKKTISARHYLMACLGTRRIPIRIPAHKQLTTMLEAREWWIVEAPSAMAARALCREWPMRTANPETGARIINHGKQRT